ncbi:MAG TPA: hypothetical protein DCX06_13610 [Opitutae bacterium]|nr:hypothetical protein [Opitutae bacterium]
MEELKEMILSKNIIVWIVMILIVVLFLKFLKNAGKIALILVVLLIAGFIINAVAPGVLDPLVDFVRGGWLGENRPTQPW